MSRFTEGGLAMVVNEKVGSALYALNAVLVLARAMGQSGRSGAEIADVLDVAEYLPRLLAVAEDKTNEFRRFLTGLAERNSDFQLAVDRFDRATPAHW
jgi:hypothetical protein